AALYLAAPGLARAGYADTLRVLAICLPVAVLADALLGATRGLRMFGPTVLLDRLLRPALQLAGVAALLAFAAEFAGPGWYALAWAWPYLPVAALAALALRRALPSTVDSSTVDGARAVRRAFWGFTAPRALASVAQVALQRVDVLLVAALAGLAAAATYAVAGRFIVGGQVVNQAISQVIQPRLAELLAAGDRDGANLLYQTATGWLVLATWPLYLCVIGLAPAYLRLFGDGYLGGTTAVVVLASAMLVATGCGMVDMVLAMGGRTSWNLANVLLALAVSIGANLVLVPRFGVTGAAVALASAVLVNNLVPLAQIAVALRLHPFGPGSLAAAGLAVGCFGVLPLTICGVAGSGPAALGGAGAAAVLGYLAGAARLRRVLRLDRLPAMRRAQA
ncbi:MAG TPA: polysaccharide biosynthesis C-terminal domain-containing protein, partial [Micromonosporaceae bacterium]|nr:polysaccharide biosynthesis C-terminal domain-containing protein [Micromonosporaceae bacterium]